MRGFRQLEPNERWKRRPLEDRLYSPFRGSHDRCKDPPMSTEEGPLKRTPLYEEHKKLGARLVPFAGWEMPVQYKGIVDEHRAVRTAAGLFDVSHMGEIELEGEHA